LAIKSAQSGDVIYLEAGTYSGIAIRNLIVDGNVTITSKDPGNPATITNINVTGSSGFTFENLEFAPNEGGQFAYLVNGSKNITFSNLDVHGSLDGNPQGDSSGISILGSSNIRIENSEFHELRRGVGVGDSEGVVIEGNKFHVLQTDGVMVSDTKNIKILDNSFSNFSPVIGDHPDAIQFLTKGTTASSEDIVISGNIITRGEGSAMQGIFMRDEVGNLAYKNVTISDNIMVGTGYNGIMVGNGENLKITGNELISYEGATNKTWILIRGANGVVAENNTAILIGFDDVINLQQLGNILNAAVSDQGEAALKEWMAGDGGPTIGDGVDSPQDTTPPSSEIPPPALEIPPPVTGLPDVSSAGSVTLEGAAKNLLLTGDANIDGTGNDLSNVITGNVGDNHLLGGAGNDTISDGYGADTMAGGTGDDTYYVNNPGKAEADVIIEGAGEGIDTVVSSSSYTLSDNVENLILTGKGGTTGKGNDLNNVVTGNIGHNIVDGGAGDDTVNGGDGADTVVGRTGSDVLTGGAGDDTFWFERGDGKDVITDFGANGDHDSLDLSWLYRGGLKATLTDVGENLVISFKTGEEITLMGVHAHELTATTKGFII
jgi:hypothetical protein